MNNKQIQLFSRMKKLINQNKRRFQPRKDRDYVLDLLDIGITEEEAWECILRLNKNFFFIDPKPSYSSDENSLIFKREINEVNAYIKLKIENNSGEEETVCLSFHRDYKKRR